LSAAQTPAELRAAIVSALSTVPDDHLPRLLFLISLGTPEDLLAELAARRDIEVFGEHHQLTATPRDVWCKGLVLGAWQAITLAVRGRAR
jgi:hypothetical protein